MKKTYYKSQGKTGFAVPVGDGYMKTVPRTVLRTAMEWSDYVRSVLISWFSLVYTCVMFNFHHIVLQYKMIFTMTMYCCSALRDKQCVSAIRLAGMLANSRPSDNS